MGTWGIVEKYKPLVRLLKIFIFYATKQDKKKIFNYFYYFYFLIFFFSLVLAGTEESFCGI